jgi:hypothetical protein
LVAVKWPRPAAPALVEPPEVELELELVPVASAALQASES